MSMLIENPAACEIRSVIHFLNARKLKPIEIYRLSKGVVFLHDNARPHTANATKNILQGFGWDVFDHPPYSPDLATSDFHLFLHLRFFLGGQYFNNDKVLKENVSNWLKTQAANFYEEGIQKFVPCYDKCLQNFSSYVEK